jgi:hypothetical protein
MAFSHSCHSLPPTYCLIDSVCHLPSTNHNNYSTEPWGFHHLTTGPTQKDMLYNTILSWTLLLPFTHALQIPSHLSTETTLLCSTIYTTSSPANPLSTTTVSLLSAIDLSPVILHNYTTSTITVTPKPFSTLFSVLATKTKTVRKVARDGVLEVEATIFKTSTFWHHVTSTKTVTKDKVLTTRTTSWISTPTGFVGVRDSSAPVVDAVSKRVVKHIRGNQRSASTSDSGKVLVKPTQGKYPGIVRCEEQVHIHTTQTLLLTASKKATVTARPETVFKNRTVYGTVTSTILALHKNGTNTLLASGSRLSSGYGYGASPTLQDLREVITNTTTTVTKTPYTISFTHTATNTVTSTRTLHATTTITSYAACASGNLLGQTRNTQRINGVAGLSDDNGVEMESGETTTASKCCESCIQQQHCLWSIYEAEGEKRGTCYLFFTSDKNEKQREGKDKTGDETVHATEAGTCGKQEQKGIFGYSGANGEVRYVVSNGLCGMLVEA